MHKNLKILVTGANGQLGSEIFSRSKKDHNNYYFTDIQQLNLTDFNAVDEYIKEINPDVIINCAAYTAVDMAENEQDLAMSVNVNAVNNLGIIAKNNNITIIHISTDYVFDGRSYLPYTELDEPNPISVYGYTKLLGENALIESGCNGVIIRTSWLYSTYGQNFFNTISRLANTRSDISIVFDQIGTPTFAGHLADAIIKIIPQLETTDGMSIYHFSNEGVCSWYDFATEIANLLNFQMKIYPIHSEEYPTTAQRPFYSLLDKSKIKNSFGIEIPHWRKGLLECVEGNYSKINF